MEMQKTTSETSWTWADQISSYRFWGLFLFFLFLTIPSSFLSFGLNAFQRELGLSGSQISTVYMFKSIAGFFGLWLAWFMVRLKNHYLLFLYSGFILIGWLLILLVPLSIPTLSISFFLIGLGFGAISLAIPSIISGGRGGSEMFIVSVGLITFFESLSWLASIKIFAFLSDNFSGHNGLSIINMVATCIGMVLLLPVKADLFNNAPPRRESFLIPTDREPITVALLGIIPLYNIYHILYMSYRFHGEVNKINPTQNILSPRAAVWCSLLLSIISPIMVTSLNTSLISKLKEDKPVAYSMNNYYKNWVVILWAFILLPVSFALIQSNMNLLLQSQSSNANVTEGIKN